MTIWQLIRSFRWGPRAFLLGMWEFRTECTTNPGDDLIHTYDSGRELAHRLTFRRWDPNPPEAT